MYLLNKRLFLIIIPLVLSSCIRDHNDDCGIYLEFIFDYNMEYADSFNPQVGVVDVYVFDDEDKLLLHKRAQSKDLVNQKQMYLTDDLTLGTYKIMTVGGQSDYIRFTTMNDEDPGYGQTTINSTKLALQLETSDVSYEFPHAWFGEIVVVNYDINRAVWPVRLVRNTNKFNLQLQEIDAADIQQPEVSPYTFEIVTPEAGAYGYDNNPLVLENVSYHPFSLTMVNEPENTSLARLNTMRLIAGNDLAGYRLIIRQTETGKQAWSCDLIDLLKNTKPLTRPDGSELPLQEYLDRQGEWNIEVLYRETVGGNRDSFVAVAITVNGWILWLTEMGV